MPDKKINAILFDLGETLLNFGKVHIGRLFQQGARLSYDFLKGLNQPIGNFKIYCWRNLLAIRLHHLLANITKKDFDSLPLLKKVNSRKGLVLNEQQWEQISWLWYEPLSKFGKIEPHLPETLSTLKSSGIKLAIVSNTFLHAPTLEKHLQQLGILDFFPTRLFSYEFDFRKPDPRIFKAAAEKIGEDCKNIMFVGDRIDSDIDPALKLGMTAVLKSAYTNDGKTPPKGTLKINRIAELPALLQKLNTN